MATAYVIVGSEGIDGDIEILARGYRTRRQAERDKYSYDGPPTRRVMTDRSACYRLAADAEARRVREAEGVADARARQLAGERLRGLVCPVTASLADYVMYVGSTIGAEERVPVGDCGLRTLVAGHRNLRVRYDGALDYDSHLIDDAAVEWYDSGVRHLVRLTETP
jgi:hypothetical protein